jgi:GT2 family glycosyltransferase
VISVVVPTKGRLDSLERCLDALRRSDYPRARFEVIVANDRGGEGVKALVRRFAGDLQVATARATQTGPSAARNAGVDMSRARYVAFTDDDCDPASDWLSALQRSLAENPGAAVGGAVRNGIPDSAGAVATQIVVESLQAHWNRDRSAPRFFPSSNVAFPRDELRAVGGFDEDFRYAEDRELCERWVRSGHRFVHAPQAVVVHMRALAPREFIAQHYGYGRGAYALQHRWAPEGRRRWTAGVLRELASRTLQRDRDHGRVTLAGYAALSQLATTSGFAREAVGVRAGRA